MSLHKEIFERFQVARLIGLGNIGEHKHLHILVEIVARAQHAGICPRLLGLAKAHGAEEVLEIVSHGDCRARIHHGMRFLVEGFVERSANIHDKSLEAFGDAFRLARKLRGIHVVLVDFIQNKVACLQHALRIDDYRGNISLHIGNTIDAFEECDELARRGDEFFGRFLKFLAIFAQASELLARAHLVVYPQLNVLVVAILTIRVTRHQVFHVVGERDCVARERTAGLGCLFGEAIEKRTRFGHRRLVHGRSALQTHKGVALRIGCGQTIRKAHNFGGVELHGKRATGFRLGAVGLIDDPIARRRQQETLGGEVAEEQ